MLKFSPANTKLRKLANRIGVNKKHVYSLDLPAGYSCPFALKCKSQVVSGKIKDGRSCEVRCYAASQEAMFPKTHTLRQHNFHLIKQAKYKNRIKELIQKSLPKNAKVVRYHTAGDFFSMNYFRAAVEVAKENPHIVFYCYTKNIPALIKLQNDIPDNFRIVASYGGKRDDLIPQWRGASCQWIFSEKDSKKIVDSDDFHAMMTNETFEVVVHGIQPARKEQSNEN